MAEKTVVTYTPEQTALIVEGYKAGESVEALAEQVGKSVRSVVAKLSREGVYTSKQKATVARVTKADRIRQIELAIGAAEGSLHTLEKASVEALQILAEAVKQDAFAE